MARNASAGDQIEFLAPNDTAFGMADMADFVGFDGVDDDPFGDEPPRSRWLPAIAGVVIVGLIGVGIVAAAPWDGDQTATAPSTVPATSIVPGGTPSVGPSTSLPLFSVPPTTVQPITATEAGSPGLVLDDPAVFRLASASRVDEDQRSGMQADDAFDLWVAPGAARTTGRWLAFSTIRDLEPQGRLGAVRLTVNDLPALLGLGADGVFTLYFVALDATGFQIEGYGFELSDLTTIAAHVGVAPDGTTQFGTLGEGVMGGMDHVVSRPIWYAGEPFELRDASPTMVGYDIDNGRRFMGLGVVTPSVETDTILQLMTDAATQLSTDDRAVLDEMDRRGSPVQIRTLPQSPDTVLASWLIPAGRALVWAYDVPMSTMIEALPQVRTADDAEWLDMVNRSNRGDLELAQPAESPRGSQPTTIARPAGESDWTVEMMSEPAYVFANDGRTGWGTQLDEVTNIPTLHRLSSPDTTFLVATAGWPNEARSVRITLDGTPPVTLAMVQLGDTPTFAVAYAYSDPLGGTIEFLAQDGTVLTTQAFLA